MKWLINASNLYVGGGVQVAVSFINELNVTNTSFCAAVSPVVMAQLQDEAREKCIVIDSSPSGLFNWKSRKKLDEVVKQKKIEKVFTIFGPSYWNPKNVKHLVGFALPWLIYDTRKVVNKLNFKTKLKMALLKHLQPYYFRKNANIIITETEDVSLRAEKLLNRADIKAYTVPNTLNNIFKEKDSLDYSIVKKLPPKNENDFWLLTISHNYPHKNLEIIKQLVAKLPQKYKFVTTVDDNFKAELPAEHAEKIICLGAVKLNQCPPLYQACDALFLPTLLECFSASYLEAMYMNKVVLTSDLPFAHAVCQDAAIYFNPNDVDDVKNKILLAANDKVLQEHKISLGVNIVHSHPDAQQRAQQYLNIILNA